MAVQLSRKIRIIFVLSQVLYMMFGAVMFAIGIYSIVNLQRFGVFTGSTYAPGAAIFIVAGVFKFVFGIVGILVVFWQKKPLMAVFVTAVIFLMMLTFVAAIYGFLTRPDAYYTTRRRLNDAFNDYLDNRDDINDVEETLDCCGIEEGRGDYERLNLTQFNENCDEIEDDRRGDPTFVLPQGCLIYLANEIQQDLYYIGGLGMGFATTELAGLLIAMQNFEGL